MYNINNKQVLVTGGAGFVGSNLVKTLVNVHNCKVTVLDDLFTGNLDHLSGVDYEFVQGTVEDVELVNNTVEGKQIVFHLAARNIILSNMNPREDLSVNVIGSFNVFDACKRYNVERIVYTSTSSIYGNPTSLPISEDDKKNFLNFYSASKFSAEIYAKVYYEVFSIPISIVRYSNIYGYNQSPSNPYCGVIGKFFESAEKNIEIKIHGDGEQTRDFTFITDAISATIAAAIYERAIGNEYNVGTGVEISINKLAELIIELTDSKSIVTNIDRRDIDNIRKRVINIEKTRHDLKYQPQVTIKKGLEETLKWYKK
ncbi:MAG: NAD-dependent epimerase/dehydratase family protein [Chitinophagaceae bacterium]